MKGKFGKKEKLMLLGVIIFSACHSWFQLYTNRINTLSKTYLESSTSGGCIVLKNGAVLNLREYFSGIFGQNFYLKLNVSFSELTNIIGFFIGLLGIFLLDLFAHLGYRFNLNCIKRMYPNEKICYSYRINHCMMALISYVVFGCLGSFILPFLFFENIYNIRMVSPDTFIYYTVYFLLGLIVALEFLSFTVILTDKRLIRLSLFRFIMPLTEMYLPDIREVKFEKNRICLYKNEEEFFPLAFKQGVTCYEVYKKIKEGVFSL